MSNNPYKQQQESSQKSPIEEAGPPSYDIATTSSTSNAASNNLLTVPPNLQSNNSYDGSTASSDNDHDGSIPRDVLDHIRNENRELPNGYIREYDPVSKHLFYVDTTKDPVRTSWIHPFDDPEYLSTLPDTHPANQHQRTSSSSSNNHNLTTNSGTGAGNSHIINGSGRPDSKDKGDGKISFGRKLKDKLTGSTHDERVEKRRKQKELEQKQYALYLKRQQALATAQANGTYRPAYSAPAMGYGYPNRSMYGNSGYGYNNGYYGGGGMGMGGMGMMGMGIGGGLLGGMLIGDMIGGGGGFGGGF